MLLTQRTLIYIVICSALCSCSPKIPFTQAVRDQYKLSPDELKRIQFFLSDPVILRRGNVEENKKSTDGGKLVVESGKAIEQVFFRASTPGTVNEVLSNNLFSVAFEDGPDKYLVFGSGTSSDGFYRLQALDWKKGRGKINYGGNTYFSELGSENAILLFRMKSLKKLKYKEQIVKGKKLN